MSKENHGFSTTVAQEVGVNCALIIQHLLFLQKSFAHGKQDFREVWVKRSVKSLRETYPYFSAKEISGANERLEKGGYLSSKIENDFDSDRTKSYRLTEKGLLLMGIPFYKRENGFTKGEITFDEKGNDISPNGEMTIKVGCTSFVPSFIERDAQEKNSPSPAENSNLEAGKNVEGENLPGGGILAEIHDGETGATIYDLIPPAPVTDPPAHRIELGDRPTAETPLQLESALRAFYVAWPNEWSIGILENAHGSRYPADRQKEIVKDFCCWAVENNRQRDTFRQINARLQGWFRNEQHSAWKQAKPGQNANGEKPTYERPKNAVY